MSKKLVAYFSASGTTANAAKGLAKAAGADLYEIKPEAPYTKSLMISDVIRLTLIILNNVNVHADIRLGHFLNILYSSNPYFDKEITNIVTVGKYNVNINFLSVHDIVPICDRPCLRLCKGTYDDVLEYFVQRTVANGIDIIRIFDALNDIKNLQCAIKAAKREGAHAQVAVSYTTGPVFTDDYYVEYAKRIADAGADSICIKDMAALLTPYRTESLVKAIKAAVDLPLQLHTHYTSGLASMCLLKGVEAGVDMIDTAISPLALGTSHAPTESMVAALMGSGYDTGISLESFTPIREYFMTLREKYIKSGLLDPKMLATNAKALIYQVPGGMLSNLLSQLKQAGKEDQVTAVLEEVPSVREDSGYPPLVTPTSQIVGTQAVFNIVTGERYKMCTNEFKDLVAGKYGTTPMPIDPGFRKKIIGDMAPVECRPADLLEPELEKLRAEIPQYIEREEDVLSYAQFPKVAVDFFKKRRDAELGVNTALADKENKVHPV